MATTTGDGFAAHMRRAADCVAAKQLDQGEAFILAALALAPHHPRALKLLALVRFKLGRTALASETFAELTRLTPDDAGARLSLGLIALKLEWFHDAVVELQVATRLYPADRRAWSFLGYAYARTGQDALAVSAFRTAEQHDLAAELERGGGSASVAGDSESFRNRGEASTLATFTGRRLEPAEERDRGLTWVAQGVLRLAVRQDLHVRASALVASGSDVILSPAKRHRQGRTVDEPLGNAAEEFHLCAGRGDAWISPPKEGPGLTVLLLERDVLYLREERIVAFDGELDWESGCIPRDGLPLLQFRGSGRVVVDFSGADVIALKLDESTPVTVVRGRIAGFTGRVVVLGGGSGSCSCEGEGVLLLWRHG